MPNVLAAAKTITVLFLVNEVVHTTAFGTSASALSWKFSHNVDEYTGRWTTKQKFLSLHTKDNSTAAKAPPELPNEYSFSSMPDVGAVKFSASGVRSISYATKSQRVEASRLRRLVAALQIAVWVVVAIIAGFSIVCMIAYSAYLAYVAWRGPDTTHITIRKYSFGRVTKDGESESESSEPTFCDNAIMTSKYTSLGVPLLLLIPLNMVEQFQKAANVYFLFMSLLLLIGEKFDLFDVSMNPYTLMATLMILMGFSVVMAGFDDWSRHCEDQDLNNSETEVLEWRESFFVKATKRKKDLQVGDLVCLDSNKPIPADLVLLGSADEVDGTCYVDTANLDGETNLKAKHARKESQDLLVQIGLWSSLFGEATTATSFGESTTDTLQNEENVVVLKATGPLQGEVIAEAPSNKLYTFQGSLQLGENEKKPLQPQQLLLRGTVLRNTKWCVGVVVYTGSETRMSMNARKAPAKLSNLDKTLNKVMVLVIGVQACIALISAILHTNYKNTYYQHWYLVDPIHESRKKHLLPDLLRYWLTFFTLYSNLLPISLYSTLELCNLIQARFINADRELYDKEGNVAAQVRSTNLCQELGQVAYVFSDKTGTLTQNVMELKRVSINGRTFGDIGDTKTGFGGGDAMDEAREGDPTMQVAIDAFLEVLAVSHTVVIDGTTYEAESPDEGALVHSAARLGWEFSSRQTGWQTCTVRGAKRTYEELALNAFNSKRKRMSLVVRNPAGEAWLLVKGADNVMLERAATMPPSLDDHIDTFAQQGLRTLVIGRRKLTESELTAFLTEHDEAQKKLDGREEALEACAENIEVNLELVGATAIEDKLQEEVDVTISNLKKAGVKIWVLTGDKLDTARIIGFSCSVLNQEMDILVLEGPDEEDEMKTTLHQMHSRVTENTESGWESALMITGNALAVCMESKDPELRHLLLEVASPCSVLIACRVSPSQKGAVVKLVRENTYPTPVTLSIGDGANDVPMIQEAQVGVGISGKEGKQAANAADFSIGQFRFLQRLLLVHGRWNYRRTCKFILYSFYKNTVLVLTLFTYSFFCGHSGTSFYEDMVRNSFNIILAWPIICVGAFDQDVSASVALKHPELYKSGRLGLDLNFRKMAEALLSALLHAIILVKVLAAAMPGMNTDGLGGYYAFGTAAFSCLIMQMNYRAAFLTRTWNWISVAAMFVGSFGVYMAFMSIYGLIPWTGMYMVPFKVVQTPLFWVILIVVPLQAMAIDLLTAYLIAEFFPTEVDLLSEAGVVGEGSQSFSTQRIVDVINAEDKRQEAAARVRRASLRRKSSSHFVGAQTFDRKSTKDKSDAGETSARDSELPSARKNSKSVPLPSVKASRSFAFSAPENVSDSRYGILRFPVTQFQNLTAHLPSWDELKTHRPTFYSWKGLKPKPENAAPVSAGSNEPSDSPLLQQKLPSKQFVLTGVFVKWVLFATGIFFIVSGMWALLLSERVSQLRVQYDGNPVVPEEMSTRGFFRLLFSRVTTVDMPFGTRGSELYERDCSLGKGRKGNSRSCTFTIRVAQDMEPPIQVMYLVSPFFQNYNTYMRSVDVRQLAGQEVPTEKVRCHEATVDSEGKILHPCGLQAQSFFNDTFEILAEENEKSAVHSRNIVFPSEVQDIWDNPPNYGKTKGATKWLHERYPGVISREKGVKDPHFIVHMRPGALGYAQKKYGVIEQSLRAGQEIIVKVNARFPVSEFDGRKFLILTTSSTLGGRNDFLGYELLLGGIFSLAAAFAVAIQQCVSPRPLGHWRDGASVSPRVDYASPQQC